jgi:hypothetical protein
MVSLLRLTGYADMGRQLALMVSAAFDPKRT